MQYKIKTLWNYIHNVQTGRDIKAYLNSTVVTAGNEHLNLDTLVIVLR